MLDQVHDAPRDQARKNSKRKVQPAAGSIDGPSVRTAEKGDARGYDAGRKITGRERFIGVDAQGFLPEALVLEASPSESRGGEQILPHSKALYPDLNVVWVDGACATNIAREAAEAASIRLDVTPTEPGQKAFEVLPRRWVVERTFAWPMKYRACVPTTRTR